jgi:hypothetical protein
MRRLAGTTICRPDMQPARRTEGTMAGTGVSWHVVSYRCPHDGRSIRTALHRAGMTPCHRAEPAIHDETAGNRDQ